MGRGAGATGVARHPVVITRTLGAQISPSYVEPRSTSRVGSTVCAGGCSPASRASSRSAITRPISSTGWCTLVIGGPDAPAKARAFANLFWKRLDLEFTDTHTELVGHSACWGPIVGDPDVPEVLLRLSVRDQDRAKIEAFGKMVPAVILSGPSSVAVTGGRTQAQEVVAYWPALVPRDLVKPVLVTADGEQPLEWPTPLLPLGPAPKLPKHEFPKAKGAGFARVKLSKLAHGRSGDKGDTANIGLVARSPEIYPWLVKTITSAVV